MPVSEFTPSTTDVGILVPARTVDSLGNETGDFGDLTRPSGEQAAGLIAEAVDEVASVVGPDVPDGPDPDDPTTLRKAAKRVTSLLAAANVELTYYPEDAGRNGSAYDKLMARYKDALARLKTDVDDAAGTDDGEESGGGALTAHYGFPPAIGWDGALW